MEARERGEERRQDLQLALDIPWMLRRLSNQPDCGLGGSGEPLNSGCDDGWPTGGTRFSVRQRTYPQLWVYTSCKRLVYLPDMSAQTHVTRSACIFRAADKGIYNLSPEDARAVPR